MDGDWKTLSENRRVPQVSTLGRRKIGNPSPTRRFCLENSSREAMRHHLSYLRAFGNSRCNCLSIRSVKMEYCMMSLSVSDPCKEDARYGAF